MPGTATGAKAAAAIAPWAAEAAAASRPTTTAATTAARVGARSTGTASRAATWTTTGTTAWTTGTATRAATRATAWTSTRATARTATRAATGTTRTESRTTARTSTRAATGTSTGTTAGATTRAAAGTSTRAISRRTGWFDATAILVALAVETPARRALGSTGRGRDHPAGAAPGAVGATTAAILSSAPAAGAHFEAATGTIAARRTLAALQTTRSATWPATATATATAAAATATTTTSTTTATATAIPAAAIAAAVTTARLGPRLEIHDIEEVALLLGIRRRILAGQHPHEPHVVRAPAHDLESLHQPGESITRDAELRFNLRGGRRCRLGSRTHGGLIDGSGRRRLARRCFRRVLLGRGFRWRAVRLARSAHRRVLGYAFCSRRLGRCFAGRRFVGHRFGRFTGRFGRFAGLRFAGLRFAGLRFAGRRFAGRRFGRFAGRRFAGRRFGRFAGRHFAGRRFSRFAGCLALTARGLRARSLCLARRLSSGRGWSGRRTMQLTDPRRLTQDDAGELGDGLHGERRPGNAGSVT